MKYLNLLFPGHRLPRNAEAISQQLALWDAQCADETIASLRKQLEEQATTAESQIARLLEDQQQRIKEGKALAGRHLEKEEDWRSQWVNDPVESDLLFSLCE